MSELTLSLIMSLICFAAAAGGVTLIRSVHFRAQDTYAKPPQYIRAWRVTEAVVPHFLWWCIVFPFAFIGILFPTVAVANLIWKFLP